MRREFLPIDTLPAWARLNGVSLSGVAFRRIQSEDGTDKGCAVVATEPRCNGDPEGEDPHPEILLGVPLDIVLSLESVGTYAKSDRYLRDVLEAVGDFGRTARGAILIFLLMQITYSTSDFAHEPQRIGVSNPWTEYVKFMPEAIPLPTYYTEEEFELLRGTSLRSAVEAKNTSLEREFGHIRESTEHISWCQKYWWDEDTGRLALDDWRYVDAVYRSRMVDLPGHGHSMVPCIDMANHASEGTVKALYETDVEGNAALQLRWGRTLQTDEEVTISYGDDKPASEMIFSYGFLDKERADAKQMIFELDIPDGDPLKMAKKVFCKDSPVVRLISAPEISESATTWDSLFVWWASVNEEDGLDFGVLQLNDGTKELKATWKGQNVQSSAHLKNLLAADPLWDIFQLRAVVIVLERLGTQLSILNEMEKIVSDIRNDEVALNDLFRPEVFSSISRLRELEGALLRSCVEELEKKVWHYSELTQSEADHGLKFLKKNDLMASDTVKSYLQQQSEDVEEDFS